MPLNRRMDRENVVHLHNGVLLNRTKNNGILKFAGKWMELEETILSEVTQSQKDKHACTQSYMDFRHRAKDYQPTIYNAREASKQGGP